jgi:hypothetical protein
MAHKREEGEAEGVSWLQKLKHNWISFELGSHMYMQLNRASFEQL